MWQMAAVLEFLHTFSLHLRLRGSFTPEELEVAIVSETAQTGLLANVHQVTHPPGTIKTRGAGIPGKAERVFCDVSAQGHMVDLGA